LDQLSELELLAERRRLLLSRSHQLRQQIAMEAANLRPAVAWVERGYSLTTSIRSVVPFIGGFLGFFLMRKKSSLWRKAGKLWSFWRIGKRVAEIWRTYSGKGPG
jgi:hypothetical protein